MNSLLRKAWPAIKMSHSSGLIEIGYTYTATDWVFHTSRVCNVWRNFLPGYTCRTTMIFRKLTDGSQKNNNLPLNICFSYRNALQNGVIAWSRMVLKTRFFIKLKILYILDNAIWFKFLQHVVLIRSK